MKLRLAIGLLVLAGIGYGGWWLWRVTRPFDTGLMWGDPEAVNPLVLDLDKAGIEFDEAVSVAVSVRIRAGDEAEARRLLEPKVRRLQLEGKKIWMGLPTDPK